MLTPTPLPGNATAACRDLVKILLADSATMAERDAERENRHRTGNDDRRRVEPCHRPLAPLVCGATQLGAEITFEDPEEEERLREAGSKGVCYLEWVVGDRKGEKVWLEGARTTLGRRTSNTWMPGGP